MAHNVNRDTPKWLEIPRAPLTQSSLKSCLGVITGPRFFVKATADLCRRQSGICMLYCIVVVRSHVLRLQGTFGNNNFHDNIAQPIRQPLPKRHNVSPHIN